MIELLFAEQCSCVVRRGDSIELRRGRGVKDLHELLSDGRGMLRGAFVADKVVGKGAAALMIAGGVEELFADVVSADALELLNRYGMRVSYTVAVPHIINRGPVELLCEGLHTVEECLPLIDGFVESLNERNTDEK